MRCLQALPLVSQGQRTAFILDTPIWHARKRWRIGLGYGRAQREIMNRPAFRFAQDIRERNPDRASPAVIDGVVGPRADGCGSDMTLTRPEAAECQATQTRTFCKTGDDLMTVAALASTEEAVGFVRAACMGDTPLVVALALCAGGCRP